jgi:hypothetical protein
VRAPTREVLFRACAILAIAAAAFHAAALTSPAIARLEYEPTYPAWRHGLFIVIDCALAPLFLRRPPWFVWVYAVLMLQVLNGHGRGAWQQWVNGQRVDWISAGVSIVVPAILLLLVIDWRDRRRLVA